MRGRGGRCWWKFVRANVYRLWLAGRDCTCALCWKDCSCGRNGRKSCVSACAHERRIAVQIICSAAMQSLQADLTRVQSQRAAQQAHRKYAKRQTTWFRHEPEVNWLKGFGDEPQIQQRAVSIAHELQLIS